MAGKAEYQLSVLIVSTSEQFNTLARRSLPGGRVRTVDTKKSASTAWRALLERSYDLVLIHTPLSDELGVDFALEAATKHQGSVVLVLPNQIYEDVTEKLIDYGVITFPKPVEYGNLSKGIRLACAIQEKMRDSAKKLTVLERKMEELRVVNRAKILLVQKGMTEEEAHDHILKTAMDHGLTKRQVAEEIIDSSGGK